MSTIRVRGKGQVTLPASLREELGWKEDSAVNAVKIGDSVLLVPKPLEGDRLSRGISKAMKAGGITLEDLLQELRKTRKAPRGPHGR